ncbi:response regulator, partial [Sulfurovum sp. bin170]|uniref:response regulator n=1 Tax=Sulfurovum sp. bin170 TaxID=2695268 RepID=UPI0013DF14C6|nr:response regulator [Sulfurovum sp. bin170]
MLIENIRESIKEIPNFDKKDSLLQKIDYLQKETQKLEKRYKKANRDRLSAAHLLTKVNEELEESLSNEKRFIASVSHELRTPLTGILGYSELLGDTELDNRQKKYLYSIVQSSNHLLALVSDLLDVAKLGDNRIELSPKEIDFDEILNDCANLIKSKLSNSIDFIVDIPMLEYKLKADDKRVKQIFINLLSNAAKFTTDGSIRFYIKELEELKEKRLKVVVNIDDTGGGIPEEISDTLFDPFQSTDKTQGTGLGLFISRQFAVMMGGDITVKSESGVGSSFSVTLVLDRCIKKELGKALNNTSIMSFHKRGEFVENLSKKFINLGVNFQNHDISSENITSALVHMVASGKFYDIAIFDIDVFKESTASIAGTLKRVNPNIKLLALGDENREKCLQIFDKVLSKPIRYQRLIKEAEDLYTNELKNKKEIDYSNLDILIVEDVELNREYEKEMLNNFFSIKCDTAENGKIAVEKVKKKRYDAILMDMRMPVMDGLEATRKIRTFDKEIPIICMSANVYKEDKIAAEESGMNDFIEKPLERIDIESKLLKLINSEFQTDKVEQIEDITIENDLRSIAQLHLEKSFNDKTAKRLFNKAMESIEAYSKRVESNFEKRDTKELIEDFHALKGVLFNLGLNEIAKEAGELQKLSEFGDFQAIIEPKEKFMKTVGRGV